MADWNAGDYAEHAAFVPAYGTDVLALLAPVAGERILDLGCGDGALTQEIADLGALVTGVDRSPDLLAAAAARGLAVEWMDGEALAFEPWFDAVFSNAALHWMKEQEKVAAGVFRALLPGGRYVGECGGFGNIAAIRTALRATLARHGFAVGRDDGQYYPSESSFRRMHEAAGFHRIETWSFARPTPLPTGIRGWLTAFRGGFLDVAGVARADQGAIVDEVEALLVPQLCDADGQWRADYVRLRWRMAKPA